MRADKLIHVTDWWNALYKGEALNVYTLARSSWIAHSALDGVLKATVSRMGKSHSGPRRSMVGGLKRVENGL